MDLLGLTGLLLLALASIRMARRTPGPAALLIAWGAVALFLGRLGILLFAELVAVLGSEGPDSVVPAVIRHVRVVLLTGGLGAIVWGFWTHEREVRTRETDR